ncbi:MAG: YdcF family protein [Flavobacteriales bacterium]|nr:YdcF family protein [Flavobacteriales bacterium]
MFYFFSKLLDFLLQPSFWVILFIVLALILKNKRKKYLIVSLLIFFIFGNEAFYNWSMSKLENPPFDSSLFPNNFEAALLLGGYGSYNDTSDKIELNHSADRLNEALALYHSKRINKIVVLSGAASEEFPEKDEGKITVEYLRRSGVKDRDILVENTSLNTHQNAVNAKSLIETNKLKGPFLLITSAFHMRRAKDCFDTQGIQTISYPADFRSKTKNYDLSYLLIPKAETLLDWNIIIKEIIGYWVYDIRGYID